MDKNPKIYLEHILDCIIKIKNYTHNIDKEKFLENSLIQDAVIRNFEIIGEATKQLNSSFRANTLKLSGRKLLECVIN